MPGVISRKVRPARGKLASSTTPASTIANFARLSKLQTVGKETLGKAAALQKPATTIEIVLTSKKRKVDDDDDAGLPPAVQHTPKKPRQQASAAPSTLKKRKTVTFDLPEGSTTPAASIPRSVSSSRKRQFEADDEPTAQPATADNGASEAEVLLERLRIQSSPVHKRTKTAVVDTSRPEELPRELLDLVDLHVAFLKALSMQCAHSGNNTPIDLRTLYPSVTRAWGKRQVTLEDIQRCVGVLSWTSAKKTQGAAPFLLCDYGRGKICVEFLPTTTPAPLHEQRLNADFESNLRALWHTYCADRPASTVHIFAATLPKALIKPCASAAVKNPVLSKGQRTLEELKNGVVRRQQQEKEKQEAKAAAQAAATNPDGTKMSLLDRIRIKESQVAALAGKGPSPEELARRAALQRAEDVAAVIGMLCRATANGQSRVSFTMQALMIKLKDSLRNPVSQEDGVACMRLLAAEVAPQWLRIVTIGGRENVICMTACQPSKAAVQERVRVLLG